MSTLIEQFLNGAQRVTTEVCYFIPLPDGAAPRQISTGDIKCPTLEVPHTNVLQTFVHQFDDKSDIRDERLFRVFQELVANRGGIVPIQDRRERFAMMAQSSAPGSSQTMAPVFIPRPSEVFNAGMKDVVDTFKTMIPFPRVREFLQYWQENIAGPIREVRLAAAPIPNARFTNQRLERHYH